MKFISESSETLSIGGLERLNGIFAKDSGEQITFSFVYSTACKQWKSDTHDHWFFLGVTSAFILGENYTHESPLSPRTLLNAGALIKQWLTFYPWKKRIIINTVEVSNDGVLSEVERGHAGVACFFTGGVDSTFTLLSERAEIDLLVSATFDFGSGDYSFVQERTSNFHNVFSRFECEKWVIGTNILNVFPEFTDAWAYLAHGTAFAAVAHLFNKRIRKAYISSSHSFGQLIPWGSHPLTDPLASSNRLKIDHYGAAYSRLEKVMLISEVKDGLNSLIVCGLPPSLKNGQLNCSKCQKCLRTMAAIDLTGANKDHILSFDWSNYKPENLRDIRLHHSNEYIFFEELAEAAKSQNNDTIYSAARHSIRKSRKKIPLVMMENYLRRRYPQLSRKPGLKVIKKNFYKMTRRSTYTDLFRSK